MAVLFSRFRMSCPTGTRILRRAWASTDIEGNNCPGQPCLNGLECATVLAPLDYTKPDAQALTLSLAKRKATASPRLGTLFLNPGGPGVSGRQLVAGFDGNGLEQYDLIGWDPRGTHDSTPVQCFSRGSDYDRYLSLDVSPDDDAELGVQISADREFGQVCLSKSGSLLQHISTTDTVRDLDLLRGLVGDSKINYLGLLVRHQDRFSLRPDVPEAGRAPRAGWGSRHH